MFSKEIKSEVIEDSFNEGLFYIISIDEIGGRYHVLNLVNNGEQEDNIEWEVFDNLFEANKYYKNLVGTYKNK